MRNLIAALLLTPGIVLVAPPLLAHHSLAAQFDESQPVTLTGVISKVEWVNPHVYLHVDVADQAGKTSTWSVETFPPGTLRRGGLNKETLGLGQKVTMLAFKARNGSPLAFLRKITFADGHELVIWLGDPEQASKVK
jgi:hypothetical protein